MLFTHTIIQVKKYNGISDLVEDFIERAHQTGKKLDHLVARVSSQDFRKQELSKIRRQWLANNPLILQQLNEVKVKRMRRRDETQMISP